MHLFRHPAELPTEREYFLSLLSGSETGFSTTAAIIIGLTVSGQSLAVTEIATFVTVMVQAFNASAGRYSEIQTEKQIDDEEGRDPFKAVVAASIQFILHLLSGAIMMIPVLFAPDHKAIYVFGLAVVMLFLIGLFKGRYVKRNTFLHALDIVFVGMLIMFVGLMAGLVA